MMHLNRFSSDFNTIIVFETILHYLQSEKYLKNALCTANNSNNCKFIESIKIIEQIIATPTFGHHNINYYHALKCSLTSSQPHQRLCSLATADYAA